jgi:drug/metabolite transporter (DMT)-like permease
VLSICWAGLLLGETLTWTTVIGGVAVILCAGAAVRVRLRPSPVLPAALHPTKSLQPAKD